MSTHSGPAAQSARHHPCEDGLPPTTRLAALRTGFIVRSVDVPESEIVIAAGDLQQIRWHLEVGRIVRIGPHVIPVIGEDCELTLAPTFGKNGFGDGMTVSLVRRTGEIDARSESDFEAYAISLGGRALTEFSTPDEHEMHTAIKVSSARRPLSDCDLLGLSVELLDPYRAIRSASSEGFRKHQSEAAVELWEALRDEVAAHEAEHESELGTSQRSLLARDDAEYELREHIRKAAPAIETAVRETQIERATWIRALARAHVRGEQEGAIPAAEDSTSLSESVQALIREIQEPAQHKAFRVRRKTRSA